jgi:GAF domain-containing protein
MWSPSSYLIDGVFATAADLRQTIDELRRMTASPVVVVTFSARWTIRSLTLARSDDANWNEVVVGRLIDRIEARLGQAIDKFGLVAEIATEAFEEAGYREVATLSFGGNLERTGGVGVIVAAEGLGVEPARSLAEQVAARALGSRPAAFTLETSLELAVLSELRKAAENSRPELPTLASTARTDAIEALLEFAGGILGTKAIVAFEASQRRPYRFVDLERKACVIDPPGEAPSWIPPQVGLTDAPEVPEPPELGGSNFERLDEFIDHCHSSRGRPRRLFGVIANRYRAYGVPYGFDDVRGRAIGVLCMVWNQDDERAFGPYELAAGRMVAQHLARGYKARHSADAVRLVTGQLSFISESDPAGAEMAEWEIECDEILAPRLDVKQIAPSVLQIIRGLVNLSGAMSATCRLLTGADGESMARYLVRLHSEGGEAATESPSQISLDEAATSVNAWVAKTGEPVYLRTLEPLADGSDYYTSADLSSFEGLEKVCIYRPGVECELCIPIFAERRLVGTVNLEADRTFAFDSMAETIAEYVQLIGIALLESRRRIGVDTVTEVEGLLDHRHRLDAELSTLAESIKEADEVPEQLRAAHLNAVDKIHTRVYMGRVEEVEGFGESVQIGEVIKAAMKSIRWATSDLAIRDLTVEPWSQRSDAVCSASVGKDAALALSFAIAQALHNVRKHGGSGASLAERSHLAMFRFGESMLGGRRNLYVAVSSTCPPAAFDSLDPQRIFREPIERNGRVSLGAFLAGETLRRCGGSAYLRVTKSTTHDWIVDAEFSVPEIGAEIDGAGMPDGFAEDSAEQAQTLTDAK